MRNKRQKHKVSFRQSTNSRMEPLGIAPLDTKNSPDSQPLNLYREAKLCPLDVFIRCMVEDSNEPLVISGKADKASLDEAWLNIYSEYCSLAGGVSIQSMISHTKAVMVLSSKVSTTCTLLNVAKAVMYEAVCEQLGRLGFTVQYGADEQTYLRQITTAESKLKADKLRLSRLQTEKPKASNGNSKPEETEFELTLMEIAKNEGYAVSREISVFKYALYVKRLREKIEALNKQYNGGRAA